jgi:hypothetical protein
MPWSSSTNRFFKIKDHCPQRSNWNTNRNVVQGTLIAGSCSVGCGTKCGRGFTIAESAIAVMASTTMPHIVMMRSGQNHSPGVYLSSSTLNDISSPTPENMITDTNVSNTATDSTEALGKNLAANAVMSPSCLFAW